MNNQQESIGPVSEEGQREEIGNEEELVVEVPVEIRAGARSPDCGPGVLLA